MTQPANKRVVTEAAQATAIGVETSRATAAEATKVSKWQPNTAYTADDVVMTPDGSIVKRLTSGTSGSSYTSTNWQSVSTVSGTQANIELNNAYGPSVFITSGSFPAVGDNTTDTTAAIQAHATTAATFGLDLVVPDGTFKVTDELTLSNKVKVRGPGTIRQATAGKAVFKVVGNNVEIKDITLTGIYAGGTVTFVANEAGIKVVGASAASPVTGFRQYNVKMSGFGQYGTYLQYVQDFGIFNSTYEGIGNGAVFGESAIKGFVCNNQISNMPLLGSALSYGVAMSRGSRITSLTTDPRSEDVVVSGNICDGIAWEAYDTHGGKNILFRGNVAINCGAGVVMGPATSTDDPTHAGTPVYSYAPIDCHAIGNTIASGTLLGTASHGVSLVGAVGGFGTSSSSTPIEYASGCSIVGNTIRGHGTASNAQHGAIYMHNTMGAVISGNAFIDSSPYGIMLYYDNRGFSISGNVFVDVWSDTNHVAGMQCAAICSKDLGNDGWISGNTLRSTGARSGAAYSNVAGIVAPVSATGTTLKNGGNDFSGAGVSINVANASWVTTTFNTTVVTTGAFQAAVGAVGSPGFMFTGDTDTGFYWLASGDIGFASDGALKVRFQPSSLTLLDAVNLSFGTTTGTKIGGATTHKMGFWGATPIIRPTSTPATATDLATALTLLNDIRTKLIAIGLIS